ncbi:MAG: AmmeMemoRadiSam system protein B [Desulfobacterales bacterium]|nr:AmmeMemoRadiSam system protein B [Desulfobacterales bacterium]
MGFLLLLPLGAASPASAEVVRQPVFAGSFYPDDPERLNALLTALDTQAGESPVQLPAGRVLKAVVMPHAGYVYSGWTAAHTGHVLRGRRYAKVIVMAPDHRVGFRNAMVSAVDAYQTPLGRIRVHPDAQRLRSGNPLFGFSRLSDNREHALEVVLPFLQHYLKDFELVPIVLGPGDAGGLADALVPYLDAETLLVVSSDLSHYLPYDQAVAYDRETLGLISGLQVEALGRRENCACGKMPLQVLMTLAQRLRWEPVLLHYANSGDTAGDRRRVVGYAAMAFYGDAASSPSARNRSEINPHQGTLLVNLARQAIVAALQRKAFEPQPALTAPAKAVLEQRRGNFVTLETHGRLRGCIGNLVTDEPLHTTVPRNALRAAFGDKRFPPLDSDELEALSISVSVLSKPVRLDYRDADDLLARLVPHRDGLILQRGRARATFLPQVWKQIPEPENFLSALCRKAGLQPDSWRREKLVVHTYRAQYFNEKP